MNKDKVIEVLNEIFNHEINGVVRYTHYALMVFGSDRLPLVTYFRNQAKESLNFLNQNNIVFDFETYPVGHGVCPENFKSMLSWLNKKML